MTFLTREGLERLISLKKANQFLPVTWKNDVEEYVRRKNKVWQIYVAEFNEKKSEFDQAMLMANKLLKAGECFHD